MFFFFLFVVFFSGPRGICWDLSLPLLLLTCQVSFVTIFFIVCHFSL